jgi:hypothetical protein
MGVRVMLRQQLCSSKRARTLVVIVFVTVAATAAHAGQFTSPDGVFRFHYPDSYRLYAGQATAEAEKLSYIPPCFSNSASVCLVYPEEQFKQSTFASAAFSVNTVAKARNEDECINYGDIAALPGARPVKTHMETINRQRFSVSTRRGAALSHWNDVVSYRAFHDSHCYELQTAITGDSAEHDPKEIKTFSEADIKKMQRELKKILITFEFLK